MRYPAVLLLPWLLAACSDAVGEADRATSNLIVQDITLPEGADELASYGQFYARDGGDRIVYVFVAANPALRSLGWLDCLRSDANPISCQTYQGGDVRWVKSPDDLPKMSDGGCTLISGAYDLKRKMNLFIACNGVA